MYIIGTIMRIGIFLILLIITWIYGDWRNWRNYSPTILFIMVINLFTSNLTYDHSLWYFQKSKFFPNDTLVDFWLTFVNFPFITLIYLSRYPYKTRWIRQAGYIVIWAGFFSLIESIFKFTKLIAYQNGWNFWWSVLVWFLMFPVFTLHHTQRQLWAWLICIGFSAFVIYYFDLPIMRMK